VIKSHCHVSNQQFLHTQPVSNIFFFTLYQTCFCCKLVSQPDPVYITIFDDFISRLHDVHISPEAYGMVNGPLPIWGIKLEDVIENIKTFMFSFIFSCRHVINRDNQSCSMCRSLRGLRIGSMNDVPVYNRGIRKLNLILRK